MSVWIHDRGELGEIPGSVEDIRWSPDSRTLLVLAADLGSDRAGAQTATKIEEAGAEEQDPKVLRPAKYWRRLYLVDAESGATRVVSPRASTSSSSTGPAARSRRSAPTIRPRARGTTRGSA